MDSLPFTVADLAVIAILIISALLAFGRGFLAEVLSVTSWAGALFAVLLGLPVVRPFARDLIQPPLLADVAAGAILFIITLIILSMLTRMLAVRVRGSALNAVDRSLGFAFGLLRGALLVCLAYIPLQWAMPDANQPAWLRQAKSRPLVVDGADWITELVRRAAGGSSPIDSADDETRKVLERDRMVRDMMSPEPKAPNTQPEGTPKGYSERERRELERLYDSNR
jgi:membrane protein required for colicin V production